MVDLWQLEFTLLRTSQARLLQCLSGQESEKSCRYVFPDDRLRYRLTRGAVRHVLSNYLQLPPAALEYGYTPRGKPLVAGAGVEFSISHTKDYLGIAVSSHPVGLDIECVDPHADYDALAPAVLARDELRRYYDLAAAARPDFLIRTWTEKEALVKATGQGLTHPLSCYEPRQIDAAHKEIAVVSAVGQHRHWFISYMGLVNRHHISVCTPHRRPAIKTISPTTTARLQQLLFAYR